MNNLSGRSNRISFSDSVGSLCRRERYGDKRLKADTGHEDSDVNVEPDYCSDVSNRAGANDSSIQKHLSKIRTRAESLIRSYVQRYDNETCNSNVHMM